MNKLKNKSKNANFCHLGWIEPELGLHVGEVHSAQRRAMHTLSALLGTTHADDGANL